MSALLQRLRPDLGVAALIAAILLNPCVSAAAPTSSDSQAAGTGAASAGHCFFRRDWKGGWKVTPDARTIYIRVSGSVYRLDLQSSYSVLKDPFAILSNKDSSNTICTPLDFRLTVSNQAGIEQWPIVERMTRLTRGEAAALPKRLRP